MPPLAQGFLLVRPQFNDVLHGLRRREAKDFILIWKPAFFQIR
jgi:hypothetical protein